jgi:Ca-activated chloride channel family protein
MQRLSLNKIAVSCIVVLIAIGSSFAQTEKELVYEGNNLYHEGRTEVAIGMYRDAIKINPAYRKANYNLGDGIYKEAMALKRSTDNKRVMGMRADSLSNLMLDDAAGQFDLVSQTVSDKDTLHKALHNLGNCRLQQKNYQAAIDAYKKSLKIDPRDEETRYNLAYAQKKKKEEDKKKDKDKKDQKQQQQQQQQEQQQPKMSKQEAERMLNALKNNEQKLQGKKKKGEGERVKTEKDW